MNKTKILTALFLAGFSLSSFATPIVNGLGGTAGFGENALGPNDDGFSAALDITSIFADGLNFFGNTYNSIYVNNNGNITFASGLSTFTPFSLVNATNNPMIAAFFADVDTSGGATTATPGGNSTGSNETYWDFDTTNGIFTATWDDVGYFNSATNLLNAFQIQLIDQGHGDFDISITYEDINWTTGNASGGSGGLGGTVARGGWNSGNGTDFEEFSWSGNESAALALDQGNGHYIQVRNGQVTPVPEPTSIALFGLTLMGLAFSRKKA